MRMRRAHLTWVFRMREIGHFAFRARNRTLCISRRETGHSGMTKYQIEDGARPSPRVSRAEPATAPRMRTPHLRRP